MAVRLTSQTLCFEGNYEEQYTFPEIKEAFFSPMVDTRNLVLGRTAGDPEIIQRVNKKLKPVGFIDSRNPELMRVAAQESLAAGCAVKHYQYVGDDWSCWFTSASQTGRIRDQFDLDALISDYRAYFGEGETYEAIHKELTRIGRQDISCFLSFSDVEADLFSIQGQNKNPGAEYARCGLLLGYPVWSTVSIIGKHLKLF
jgi:hypothetical protein